MRSLRGMAGLLLLIISRMNGGMPLFSADLYAR